MVDVFDKAQELDQLFRDRALASHKKSRSHEKPDEDEFGNRYCLTCGIVIPPARIKAIPDACHCVSCQSRKEPR
ncbi:conjugal transfer protein TraR [Vibrio vulnificus CladeA-yb158]|uniref:TraR/DksA family transcriptional regulator n=1 Tax=Vibrio TaxID=662 RepID=UPI00063DA407|nr:MULTISPECIES: TraR/DksA family transcriptional regulator [Vibrio]KLI66953.1 conjugal transfer protein TraR [Vibrio vulnificus CladeA-yb158]MDF5594946.1 TraR/DksA family transcriptional regulator [Vibrio parahaemolyticus]MDG3056162.1 TraR/DksA family transcriptional regulator [Vibrio parahaemolyticus]MDK9520145.1 TraR/DksA family transcriptional regulator [Vibrio parahaemolyticus]